jgi:hypothetical protein
VHKGIIRKGEKIYVGQHRDSRAKIVQGLHDSSIGGHSDILGTYQRVKQLFHNDIISAALPHLLVEQREKHSQPWSSSTYSNSKRTLGND